MVSTTTTIPLFTAPPVLIALDGQVSVVRDYDYPVYYTEEQYWTVRDDGWYHTPRWDQPWATAAVDIVPQTVLVLDHTRYVHYNPMLAARTWSEANVRYSGPPLFYDPPPLVAVDSDVYVVEDFEVPVYYTGGYYWQYRSDRWYRAARWNQPWVIVEVTVIPTTLVHRDHRHYARYHDGHRDYVYREPRRHAARADHHAALVRQARADLRREREQARVDRERRSEHPRATYEKQRNEQRRAQDRRVEDRREPARRPQARPTSRTPNEAARVGAQRAEQERRQKARMQTDWKRKPTPASAPAERRKVEPRNHPKSPAAPRVAPRKVERPSVVAPRVDQAPRPADKVRKPATVHKKSVPKGARPPQR